LVVEVVGSLRPAEVNPTNYKGVGVKNKRARTETCNKKKTPKTPRFCEDGHCHSQDKAQQARGDGVWLNMLNLAQCSIVW
jgi:hypothetical protein